MRLFYWASYFDKDLLSTSTTLRMLNWLLVIVHRSRACLPCCLQFGDKMGQGDRLCPNWKKARLLWSYYRCRAHSTVRPSPLVYLSRTTDWNYRPGRRKYLYWTWTIGRRRSGRIRVWLFMWSWRQITHCWRITTKSCTTRSTVLNHIPHSTSVVDRGT
jgi:hypothetical protein